MSIFTKMYKNMITIEKFPVTVIKNNSLSTAMLNGISHASLSRAL